MKNVVQIALERREQLEQDILNIDKFLDMHKHLSKDNSPRKQNNVKKLVRTMEKIIRDADRPLTRGEITEGVERLGIIIIAKNKPQYLGSIMWRNRDVFHHIEGEGYAVDGVSGLRDS